MRPLGSSPGRTGRGSEDGRAAGRRSRRPLSCPCDASDDGRRRPGRRDLHGAGVDRHARGAGRERRHPRPGAPDRRRTWATCPTERARKLRQSSSRLLGVAFELQQPFHGDLVERALRGGGATRVRHHAVSAVAPSRDETTRGGRAAARAVRGGDPARQPVRRRRARRRWPRGCPPWWSRAAAAASGVGVVRSDDLAGIAPGRRSPRRARAPAHRAHRRRGRTRQRRPPGRVPADDGPPRAGRHRRGPHRRPDRGGRGAQAMRELLDRPPPPTAIVAFNDRCATGVLDTLVHHGRHVPARRLRGRLRRLTTRPGTRTCR